MCHSLTRVCVCRYTAVRALEARLDALMAGIRSAVQVWSGVVCISVGYLCVLECSSFEMLCVCVYVSDRNCTGGCECVNVCVRVCV